MMMMMDDVEYVNINGAHTDAPAGAATTCPK